MTPKRQRLWFAIFGMTLLVGGILLILNVFRDNLVFFFTPTDIKEKNPDAQQLVRLGGLVKQGSLYQDGMIFTFVITDLTEELPVTFTGFPPALFREGQGVVAEGYLTTGTFKATKLLAKHDENYMPPNVAEALKKSGRWKEGSAERP